MAAQAPAAASAAVDFVTGVSSQTGIDPRVLVAWIKQEGAYASGGTGGFNFLNLRPIAGDPYSGVSSGNFEQFASVNDAVAATVRRLSQPFAAPILRAARAKAPPASQIAAIAATGWDAGHYGGAGGPSLVSTFKGLYGPGALAQRYTGQTAQLAGSSSSGGFLGGVGGVLGTVGSAVGAEAGALASDRFYPGGSQGALGQAGSALDSIGKFLGKITDAAFLMRAGEVIAGAGLVAVGTYLLARQIGLAPSPPPLLPTAALAGMVA